MTMIPLGTTVRRTPFVESVFDEYDIEGLSPAPKRRTYDDSGRSTIVTVRRAKPTAWRKALKKQAKIGLVNSRDK